MTEAKLKVLKNQSLNENVFKLELQCEYDCNQILPGQFLNLKTNDSQLLLRRPFCISRVENNVITLIIAKVGKGTQSLSNVKIGEELIATLPLGNSFKIEPHHQKIALVGGGVGTAPLLSAADYYKSRTIHAFLGFPNKNSIILEKEFSSRGQTFIATDDGSYGFKGYVTDLLESKLTEFKPDIVLACGPHPMLAALHKVTTKHSLPCLISTEARMGCGVGACLVCTCPTKNKNNTTSNKRVCADGPVFDINTLF